LRGIVSQRLVRKSDGSGRVAVVEVMVNTGRTAEAIVDPYDNPPMQDLIAEGEYYKMQTFDQHLFRLIRDGKVTYDDACTVATNAQDLTVALRGAGIQH
jgi:twitching motility protein PilT